MKHIYIALMTIFFLAVYTSCSREECIDSSYTIHKLNRNVEIDIVNWNVRGAITLRQDSIVTDNYTHLPQWDKIEQDSMSNLFYNGEYHPKYGQLDLKELYSIPASDTTHILDSLVTYLSCTITAEEDIDIFLYVKTEMKCKEYVNGKRPVRISNKKMKIYSVHLNAGENSLTVRVQGKRKRYWYEATICDSTKMCNLYTKLHTGDIVYPCIHNNSVHLTDNHWAMSDSVIRLLFHDVCGKKVSEITLEKGISEYHASGMEDNHAYICSMIKGIDTVRQPVMTGTSEYAIQKYTYLRDSITDKHPRANEIDGLMYRLRNLQAISENMKNDRWFDYKLPWVIYQLEHTFAHLNSTYGNDNDGYNLQFITYKSKLDNGLQRYILMTPNTINRDKKYALVIVVRPYNQNHHHLFFSPQISRQHVVNIMQSLANEYDCFIIMPEARMYLDEDLTPFAETEMKIAIEDVQEHYNIDPEQIYLHANCSGGYRALRLAENNPDMFAGIALYAPMYRTENRDDIYTDGAPETMLDNLRNTPVFIYGDPADTHSPIGAYVNLIRDCEEKGIPYTLMLRMNKGRGNDGYHRHLVGKDAFDFFKDRKKSNNNGSKKQFKHPKDTTIADFYDRPFIYVYNAADTSIVYKELVDSIRNEYERYLYSPLPLVPDTRVTRKMLREKNIFLIGDKFECYNVRKFVESINRDSLCSKDSIISLTVYEKPNAEKGKVLLYASDNGARFRHSINYPWKRGFRRKITIRLEGKKQ